MPICRLVYRSQTSWEKLTNEALRDLEGAALRRNDEFGITGMLVLSGETFLQVLEGEAEVVNRLYGNIMRDKRHFRIELLSYEQITSRLFDNWGMRLTDLNDLHPATRKVFRAKYNETDGYVEIPGDQATALALLFDAKALCLEENFPA